MTSILTGTPARVLRMGDSSPSTRPISGNFKLESFKWLTNLRMSCRMQTCMRTSAMVLKSSKATPCTSLSCFFSTKSERRAESPRHKRAILAALSAAIQRAVARFFSWESISRFQIEDQPLVSMQPPFEPII